MAVVPYGAWRSPISAGLLVERAVSLSQIEVSGEHVFWIECRPSEGGRQVIVRRGPDGLVEDVIPPGFSARTTVHEYGGGAYAVHGRTVFFSNYDCQRIFRVEPKGSPRPITPESLGPEPPRYANASVSPGGEWLACVRERRAGSAVINELAAIDANGDGEPCVLASEFDFYAAPTFSPDGQRLAWICWNLPCMPWDSSELWVADVQGRALSNGRRIAGGADESVAQPRWSPEGRLFWISDRTGWWNLYADDGGAGRPIAPLDAEFSGADWMFGQATYAFLPDGRLMAVWWRDVAHLVVINPESRAVDEVPTPYTALASLKPQGRGVVTIAGSSRREASVVLIDAEGGDGRVLRPGRQLHVADGYLSTPEPIEFPTRSGRRAHALFYPPANRDFTGPPENRPPLISMTHGGPTHVAAPALSTAEEAEDAQGLAIHFWTSRGFAVVDVNYSGSTGYGREYRNRLRGEWGVADVHDCIDAARFLVERGEVDERRLVIRGGSAGGYLALCALTFHDVYAAGASYFGIADLELLAADTHKFESKYVEWLVGPYPAARDVYRQRSPVHAASRLSVPLIIFQGLDDMVVPPEQAEVLVSALRANGVPFAYLTFEGEGHGFRRAETMTRALEAELWFYGRILGFEPADRIAPVAIENSTRGTGTWLTVMSGATAANRRDSTRAC